MNNSLTTEKYNKSRETNKNPFKALYDKHTTRTQRAETIAHLIWEVENTTGSCSYGTLMNAFPTWSMDTIEAGVKMFNKFKFDF